MNENKNKTVGAAMVVGGGITGMQSALDLANSGYKVYLVEKSSSIGGRMSQLDKTFPTNDCSMCMISPKLIEVAKHRNIELLANTEVESVSGQAGNFSIKVNKKARYIDLDKCTGCGDCVTACPVDLKNEFEQGLNNRKAVYKKYPQAIPGVVAISKDLRAPCKINCPAGCNGQGYVALTSKGKYQEAFDHIMQWIPLPASVGRVCHHPCEQACNRAELDEPIGIAPIKAFVADTVRAQRAAGKLTKSEKPKIDPSKGKVAIVGAGPSGLTAAYDLIKKGYAVTIFESTSIPGGQLQWAIPKYRLPKEALAADIKDIIDLGIELKLNFPIGEKFTLDDIKSRGYKAIYLAIGTQKNSDMAIPGDKLSGVIPALEFLKSTIMGNQVNLGKKLVIVGGGNVAMDCARSAVRLGKDVTVVYRRTRSEMPANPWEINEAEEEGVKIENSWGPKEVIGQDGKVTAMEFQKFVATKAGDRSTAPSFDASVTRRIECDNVILAIGQATDLSIFSKKTKVKTAKNGLIITDPVTLATDEPGVFAGGDGVSGPKSAVEAIAHGHEAAISIERYLSKKDLREGREKVKEEAAGIPEGKFPRQKRVQLRTIPMEKRVSTFDEAAIMYSEEEARKEADRCLNCGLCSECMQCVAVCQAKAVDHTQKDELVDLNVGSVILAPGFDAFDAKIKGEYGYGRMPNVVTSLEFERILSASGPYQGAIKRPSDGRHPVKVAWIQCVGSRDKSCGNDYCSSVCCMYATKEAIIAREHESTIQPTIFYNDIRAFGKGFERYYESAKDKFGVRYVNSIPSMVKELQKSHNLLLDFTDDSGKKVQEEFDLVVLSVGLVPSAGTKQLAEKFGVAVDRFGFCSGQEMEPNVTSQAGIFVAGAFTSPIDIPESVMSASGAACLAGQVISSARGTLVTEKVYPAETEVAGEEPKVGVFVCRCGSNIARVVDVPAVVAYAKTIPHVVLAEENLYTCSTDTQAKMIKTIREKGLNRVVVASCSPRTHEPLFQDTIQEGGLNKYLFDMANIRDQCSWVHASHMPESTEKAKDLVRMAVARAETLLPLHQQRAEVTRRALIIGGGLAGMTAAKSFADQGFEAVLIEREKELGGNARKIFFSEHEADPQTVLNDLIKQVESNPTIKIYKGAQVNKISGFLGNYSTEITTQNGVKEEITHGVVVIATGGTEYKPTEYSYGQTPKIITQLELEKKLILKEADVKAAKSIAMIQCVGSREPEHLYCSRICCSQAINNAIQIKEINPDAEVFILYRDIRTYGMHELNYRKAREMGVVFIHFDAAKKPEVTIKDGNLQIKVTDKALNKELTLNADLLALSAAVRPQPDVEEFARSLKLPLTQEKFVMEAHMKLRPLDLVNEGMYLCGLAHSPKTMGESIAQARGAVSKALTVLSQPYLMVGGVISVVDQDKCVACLTCVRSCPYDVPKINEKGVAYIEPAACQGCGICASVCPRKAITLQHYSDKQIIAKVDALKELVAERS
jgi:heterodisulfide reductase subunit A-like polyferredoxin